MNGLKLYQIYYRGNEGMDFYIASSSVQVTRNREEIPFSSRIVPEVVPEVPEVPEEQ